MANGQTGNLNQQTGRSERWMRWFQTANRWASGKHSTPLRLDMYIHMHVAHKHLTVHAHAGHCSHQYGQTFMWNGHTVRSLVYWHSYPGKYPPLFGKAIWSCRRGLSSVTSRETAGNGALIAGNVMFRKRNWNSRESMDGNGALIADLEVSATVTVDEAAVKGNKYGRPFWQKCTPVRWVWPSTKDTPVAICANLFQAWKKWWLRCRTEHRLRQMGILHCKTDVAKDFAKV